MVDMSSMSELLSQLWVFVMVGILRLTAVLAIRPTPFRVTSFLIHNEPLIQTLTLVAISFWQTGT